jgi:hypothetical protein
MPQLSPPPPRRDTSAYRAFKAQVLAERPVCEHCCRRPSRIVAHKVQPLLGAPLIDKSNVLALCPLCDGDFTRRNPPLKRRKLKGVSPCPN